MSLQHLIPPWLASLVPYPPGKPIEEVEREYGIRDSIKLASNENPLGPSPRAVAALRGRSRESTATRTAAGSISSRRWRRSSASVRSRSARQRLERDHRARRAHLPAPRRGRGDVGPGVRHLSPGRSGGRGDSRARCRCATSPTTSRRSPTRFAVDAAGLPRQSQQSDRHDLPPRAWESLLARLPPDVVIVGRRVCGVRERPGISPHRSTICGPISC